MEAPVKPHNAQHWNCTYNSKPADQLSWFQPTPSLPLAMVRAAEIDRDARIIDVGAGASNLVDHLLAVGYRDLTVLDIADAALERSKLRLGYAAERIHWLTADITTWQPATRYSLWHDRAVFHFLTEAAQREAYIANLRLALQPGGTVILSTFALNGPERCSGLHVQRYSPETLAATLGSGFSLIQAESEQHLTPSSSVQNFTCCRFVLS